MTGAPDAVVGRGWLTALWLAGAMTVTVGSGDHMVLCLHGWFGSARGWGMLAEAVDERTFTYVFVDARGYGSARGASGEFTMQEFGTDAVALADDLGAERFSVLGHSMGGKAAAYAQVLAPERVRSVVGVNPVPPSAVPMDESTWQLFSGAVDAPANRRAIIDMTTGNRHSDAWLDKMVEHSQATSDRDAFAAYAESWINGDVRDRIGPPDVPLLLIAGANDPAMSAEVMQQTWMQWYPKATLVTMNECGHYPMFETPVALAGEIEAFLRAH